MKTHLRLDCYMENEHPQIIMKNLGITYQKATPQSIGEQWWFWNCENIPCELPKNITFLEVDPLMCIGYGLSEKEALEIVEFK